MLDPPASSLCTGGFAMETEARPRRLVAGWDA